MVKMVFKVMTTVVRTLFDVLVFLGLNLRSRSAVAAENSFLRKQLALYIERKTKPRRATDSIRFTLAQLSRLFAWREGADNCQTGYADSLAPKRISPVLEMEVSLKWPSAGPSQPAEDARSGRARSRGAGYGRAEPPSSFSLLDHFSKQL